MANNNPKNVNKVLDTNYTTAGEQVEESSLDLFLLNLNKKEKAQLASDERVDKAQKILMDSKYQHQIQQAKDLGGTEEEIAARVAKIKKKMAADVIELAQKMEENLYRYSDKLSKIRIKGQQQATLQRGKEELKQQLTQKMADDSHIISKAYAVRKLNGQVISANREEIKLEEEKRNLTISTLKEKRKYGIITGKELTEQFEQISDTYEAERQGHEDNIDFINEQIEAQKKFIEENKGKQGAGLAIKQAEENIAELETKRSEEKKSIKQGDKDRFNGELLANTMKAGFQGIQNSVKYYADKFIAGVDSAIDTVGQFKSVIDARLQGTQSSYEDVAKTMKGALAISPFVKQTEVLKKLNDAVDKGIAYNVEQRAFLATMTDKIVATFDAFDSNLMRIIRLQQADTTAARMGMESNLLQFFNSTFSDNSYLADGYDQVSQALVDANAQMTRDMSISFEFNVQKWMGSLASLGFGTDTITTIAQGINNLGSGNVQALAGNTQLQNLLAMSASRAGLSYSELLVKGIDDSSVNTLLKAMVEYLAEIAKDDNAVVKAAYGDVFNFTQADLRAIKNLTDSDIANISNQTMSYSKAMSEVQNQLNQVGSRLSMTEMINNVFDNFLYSSGESLARNPATAILWKTLNVIEGVTGGIEVPSVYIGGFGLDLHMSVEQLMRTGMFGLSAISQVGNMLSSIQNGGGMNLDIWGGTEFTQRGGNFDSTVGGVQSTKSGSKQVITSGSSSDTKKAAIATTEEDQEEQKKKSKEQMEKEITVATLYKEIFEKQTPINVLDNPVLDKLTEMMAPLETIETKTTSIDAFLNGTSVSTALSNVGTINTNVVTIKGYLTKDNVSVAAITNDIKTKIGDLYDYMSGADKSINVKVNNFSELEKLSTGVMTKVSNLDSLSIPEIDYSLMPTTVGISSIGTTCRENLAQEIADRIVEGMTTTTDTDDSKYNIADLVYLLLNGVIQVHDSGTIDKLTEMNSNLI